MVSYTDVLAARARIAGRVLHTPTIPSDALSRATGADIFLKLENLHPTGAFKERGAANKLAMLTEAERRAGVVAMSAGNHAQAVARHAKLLGIRAVIVMPRHTPATKVTRTAAWDAEVVLHGDALADAAHHAEQLAHQHGLVFVHPYDDPAIIAGQGTMALELIEDSAGLDALIVPVGGGGFLAGCAIATNGLAPHTQILGVQVAGYASLAQILGGHPVATGGPTIAEGIAVARVGGLPLALARQTGVEILVVAEHEVEAAIALLAEQAKLVAEGAGAAALAAVLANPARFAGKRIGLPVCGGNIDTRILANVLLRNMLRDGRLLRMRMDIPDRPGVLADIAARIGGAGGNIIDVSHHRLFASPNVQSAELEVVAEARDATHGAEILAALRPHYTLRLDDLPPHAH